MKKQTSRKQIVGYRVLDLTDTIFTTYTAALEFTRRNSPGDYCIIAIFFLPPRFPTLT